MPIIDHSQAPQNDPFPGIHNKALVTKDKGSAALTVGEVTLDPGMGIPLHIHPNHEEAILLLEGEIEGVLEGEVRTLSPGYTLLAPAGVKHTIRNRSQQPAKCLTIFPTTNVQRVIAEGE
ncbi:MAG: cupin domain-containing protein [Dehalococcoidia bacterium]